ncbi:fimbrial protein [Burkholderia pyrrocinia]|uniref:fimbrial protein n=1 Tax=Burkholderia pyrrocinia TaxID=60550 RepID=UPI002AB12BF0|nr:fimbrial protein [Burkholderia pyrrocinia]
MKPSNEFRPSARSGWNTVLQFLALGCALLVASSAARAAERAVDCTTATYYPAFSPALPASISSGRDSQTPGALVGPNALSASQNVSHYTGTGCDGKYFKFRSIGTLVPGVSYVFEGRTHPVYETGIPGIGYALMASVLDPSVGTTPWSAITSNWMQISSGYKQGEADVRVALVFTGPLVTGSYSVPFRQIAELVQVRGTGETPSGIYLNATKLNVTATGCSLTSSTQNDISLPQLVASALTSIGDTSSASGTTSLRVNCKQATSIYVTLTDIVAPGNTGNVLSLAPGSTAEGVGIQVFKQNSSTPLGFGPDSSIKGNTNQWLAGTLAGSGDLNIPIVAKYVKTAPKITPGEVKARASFTFSYQ